MKLVKRFKSDKLKRPNNYIRLKKSKAIIGLIAVFTLGFLLSKYEIYKKVKGTFAYEVNQSEKKVLNEVSKLISIDKTRHKLYFNIKQVEMDKLHTLRNKAVSGGHLYRTDDDYVRGKLKLNGKKSIPVKFRLKGDHIDHLKGNKWSFRIKVKGNHSVLGMKKFSIQAPETRNNLFEWMFHSMLREEGLISLRYHFVRVYINGKDKGVFALEEHFDKRLLESNQLKDGPIIKFSEVTYWNILKNHKLKKDDKELLQRAEIVPFNSKNYTRNSSATKLFQKALMLLEDFRIGKLKTSEVFNIKNMAKYLAIVDLTGSYHGSRWHNSRFYYNPLTSLLSPVGYDAGAGRLIKNVHGAMIGTNIYSEPFNDLLFKDHEFYREYLIQLKRIGSQPYLNNFVKKFKNEIETNEDVIQIDNVRFRFSLAKFKHNAKFISSILNPQGFPHAYIKYLSQKSIGITVGNTYKLPIEVVALKAMDYKLTPETSNIVLGKELHTPTNYSEYVFILPSDYEKGEKNDLVLQYKVVGTSKIREAAVRAWEHAGNEDLEKDFLRTPSNLSSFKFLTVNKEQKEIIIRSGSWTLSKGLIIPRNYTLIIQAGTKLNMIKKGLIVSYSPVRIIGTKEEPISIYSKDKKGQGIVVYNAPTESVIRHTHFRQLTSAAQGNWKLTGSVTFYESDADIAYSSFSQNSSEDALNIVRSKFTISDSTFGNTFSDAFDSDFSIGEMENLTFREIGNDSIDVSETHLKLNNIIMEKIGDKAVSAGESSKITAKLLKVNGAELGIVSKDNSLVVVDNLHLKNTRIALCAFRKKEEFGPGVIQVSKFKSENPELESLIEKGSKLVINGKSIIGSRKDVKDVLYGAEYGKKTVR